MTDGRKGGFRKIKNEFVVKYTNYLLKKSKFTEFSLDSMRSAGKAVSYTHLTLPTICSV